MSPPADLSGASDQEVVALARQGHEEAYRELLRRYQRPVLAQIYRIVRHRERAQDLTQETFVKVIDALDRYHPEQKLAPWILTIAHNTALHYVERKRFDSYSPFAVTPSQIDARAMELLTPGDTPTPRPDTREFAAALDQALKRLRPEYRRCFVLHHVEERTYEEIAAVMHVPAGTVGTYLHRARKQLKRMLGPFVGSSSGDPARTPV